MRLSRSAGAGACVIASVSVGFSVSIACTSYARAPDGGRVGIRPRIPRGPGRPEGRPSQRAGPAGRRTLAYVADGSADRSGVQMGVDANEGAIRSLIAPTSLE